MKRLGCICAACKHCRKWHKPVCEKCGCEVFI